MIDMFTVLATNAMNRCSTVPRKNVLWFGTL